VPPNRSVPCILTFKSPSRKALAHWLTHARELVRKHHTITPASLFPDTAETVCGPKSRSRSLTRGGRSHCLDVTECHVVAATDELSGLSWLRRLGQHIGRQRRVAALQLVLAELS